MRYSTVPAIDADALIAHNRELLLNAPFNKISHINTTHPVVWHDGQWIVNPIYTR